MPLLDGGKQDGGWRGRVARLARRAAPWFDPRSRRPLVTIAVVALAVVLAPLALDVARAVYFGWPRWVRWGLGQAALVGLCAMGLRRLWRVRPGDQWPSLADPPHPGNAGCFWLLRLAVLSLAVPLLAHPHNLGFADWDFVLDKFEAIRRTVLIWGQFPWWNPWCRGGFPLAAEPQIGAVSLATPLILAFGTTPGMALAALACIVIAVEGALALGWQWLRERWGAAAVALVYGLNGAVIINTAWGYVIPMSYCSLPWLVFYAFRLERSRSDGLWLGFWLAVVVLNGIQYLSLYAAVLVLLIGLRGWRIQPAGHRLRLLGNATAAAGALLILSGWRLTTVWFLLREDAREQVSVWNLRLGEVARNLVARPHPDWPQVIPVQHLADSIETTAYVGVFVVALVAASLYRGWRWWHTLTAVCLWLSLGSLRWYHPSFWLLDWPGFESLHVVTRWRFVAMLGLGLAAGDLVARLRHSARSGPRFAAVALVLVIGADYTALAHQQLPLAFSLEATPERFPGPPVATIVNVRAGIGYACVQRGYGVIEGYEPMLGGYHRDAPTLRRARTDPDYQGEAWTAGGEVHPTYWSPNRIVFELEPRAWVEVNQNPGSWWLVNGRRVFAEWRCAEPLKRLRAQADEAGRLELVILPRGLGLGIALHIGGAAILAVLLVADRSRAGPAPLVGSKS